MSLFLREHFGAARLMAANAFNLLSALWRAAVVPKWKAEEKAIFRLDLQSRLDRKYLDRKACTLLGYRQMERLQARSSFSHANQNWFFLDQRRAASSSPPRGADVPRLRYPENSRQLRVAPLKLHIPT